MYSIVLQGFMVGLAYVAPIGMQNAYVIQSATMLKRREAVLVALITIFFDVTLALACFFGVGLLLEAVSWLRLALLGLGSMAVAYIGMGLLLSKHEGMKATALKTNWMAIITMCFTVTWLNPQAIIDGTMLLSGFRASLEASVGYFFIGGVALASITWFLSLTLLVGQFSHKMTAQVLTWINRICGMVILGFAVKLAIMFVTSIRN